YLSGERAGDVAMLKDCGLDVRIVEGPVGAASALKMSYAGIVKCLAGIGAAMVIAATRAGAADALRDELALSQP
ncbi:6-phosphogluconate dehydrogenase, partial [Salmonella enterica subsp. enterica serovar 4:-:1,2]|nr:6-phosphogluconate dehydrogenase [Salmonella enterica subsp. enterica serovar 4:-:1,2]